MSPPRLTEGRLPEGRCMQGLTLRPLQVWAVSQSNRGDFVIMRSRCTAENCQRILFVPNITSLLQKCWVRLLHIPFLSPHFLFFMSSYCPRYHSAHPPQGCQRNLSRIHTSQNYSPLNATSERPHETQDQIQALQPRSFVTWFCPLALASVSTILVSTQHTPFAPGSPLIQVFSA